MLTKNQKLEIDEASEALERHSEGMQNKINQSLPDLEIKDQLKYLQMVPASFGSHVDPLSLSRGKVAWCACGDKTFLVFQLDHQDHLHLQCSHCGTSYCPVGKCKLCGDFVATPESLHCAGALIYLEKREESHQMMRICERLGFYDRTKLNMSAPVL